jgi:hypothetical protein
VRFRMDVDSHDRSGNSLGYLDYDNSS